jgi:hypothetical protein
MSNGEKVEKLVKCTSNYLVFGLFLYRCDTKRRSVTLNVSKHSRKGYLLLIHAGMCMLSHSVPRIKEGTYNFIRNHLWSSNRY